ncbi:MAG: hypothetical protein KUL86_14225 [Castellaniella sp.]|nr:hypothetical protein [Castellaniella sp.]
MHLRILGSVLMTVILMPAAHALEVSESAVNTYVSMKLPKSVAGVQLLSPKVTLLEGQANFCAIARPKLFPKDIEFCSALTPQWRQETASLLGTSMSLSSLNIPGAQEKQLAAAKTLVNNTILPALEGITIYQADNFIGRRVSSVKAKHGKLDVEF